MISFKKIIITSSAVFLTSTLLYASLNNSEENFDESLWAATVNSLDSRLFYAPHDKDGQYFNPWMPMPVKGFFTMIKWRLSSRPEYTIEEKDYLPSVKPLTSDYINSHDNFITWIGHASILLKISGRVIFIDPVFGDIMFLKDRRTPSALSYEEASKIHGEVTVLLTHNHYDHFDTESIESLPALTDFIVPKGLSDDILDIRKATVKELDWWEITEIGGVRIVFLPSQHWSKRGLFDTNRSLWGSYLIDTGKKKIFICGDTGYSTLYNEIASKFPDIDYAFMSTGASQPRWFMHYTHQNEHETVRGFKLLGAKKFIPIHWGSFSLGDEPAGYSAIHLKKIFPETIITGEGEIMPL